MKNTELILKITALALALAAAVCLIVANLERISEAVDCLWAKVQAKKAGLGGCCEGCDFEDEFEDWDI